MLEVAVVPSSVSSTAVYSTVLLLSMVVEMLTVGFLIEPNIDCEGGEHELKSLQSELH